MDCALVALEGLKQDVHVIFVNTNEKKIRKQDSAKNKKNINETAESLITAYYIYIPRKDDSMSFVLNGIVVISCKS